MDERHLISIVVAVKNGERTLRRCLESLQKLGYTHREIIVVNDGSTDDTAEIAADFTGGAVAVRVITTGGVGPSAARNEGIRSARGAFIAFTDGDCIAAPDWLDELLKGFDADGRVGGVGGDQRSPDDETAFGKRVNGFLKKAGFVADYVKSDVNCGISETSHNPTCNVMYHREVFEKSGMFCPGLWPGEDVEQDLRVKRSGYQLRYNPKAVVYHYRPSTQTGFFRMMLRYGEAQGRLVRKYGVFRKVQLIPLCVLGGAAAWIAMAAGGLLVPLLLCIAGAGAAFFMCFYRRTDGLRQSVQHMCLAATAFACWHIGFIKGLRAGMPVSPVREK